MLILGLLLVVVSGAAAAVLIAYNTAGPAETVTAFGRDIANVTLMQAFVAGVVVALVFLLGLWMIMSAARRGREHRARFREARREAKVAAKERDELADRIRKDEEVRSEQETVAMPAANHAGEPVEGRHAQPTDRHQQPVITNVNEGQTPAK
jgi:ABC-type nickel/cobalt efflux system permease component RcnA